MCQGPLCPNLTKRVQKEESQIANQNFSHTMLLGGLSVNFKYFGLEIKLAHDVAWRPAILKLNQ